MNIRSLTYSMLMMAAPALTSCGDDGDSPAGDGQSTASDSAATDSDTEATTGEPFAPYVRIAETEYGRAWGALVRGEAGPTYVALGPG